MKQFAFLLGSAATDFIQKKISLMHEKLIAEGYSEREITIFPNGVNELLLEYALNNCLGQNATKIFLYICALSQDCIKDDCVALGCDEVRKSVIAYYAALAEKMGIGFQVRYETDGELIAQESLGYKGAGGEPYGITARPGRKAGQLHSGQIK